MKLNEICMLLQYFHVVRIIIEHVKNLLCTMYTKLYNQHSRRPFYCTLNTLLKPYDEQGLKTNFCTNEKSRKQNLKI